MEHEVQPITRANHPRFSALPADNKPLTPPIYQSVKFTIDSFQELKRTFRGEREGYFYSRARNPTCAVLDNLLAEMQGTEGGRSTASGIASITNTLLAVLQSGDRFIYFLEAYGPSRNFAEQTLTKFGITSVRLSMGDVEGIKRELAVHGTKAILFESVSNPQLRAAPLDVIYEEAKKNGVLTLLDNTFAGFQSWPEWPFDLYLHSLTKYAGGHGDVMGGAILGREELLRKIDKTLLNMGSTLDPHAAFLIQRGMKTYHLRRREQCSNALKLAAWLETHPAVEKVVYPGLASHPQHAWFKEKFQDYGTIIFLRLKNKRINLENIVTRGSLFKMAGSLGSTESLINPAFFFFAHDLSPEEREIAGIDGSSIRLSIGIEDAEDLRRDLDYILGL